MPENPQTSRAEFVGNLWIQTADGSTINVQLSQFEGRLREFYVLFIDPKHPKRKLPETWTEVSREAVDVCMRGTIALNYRFPSRHHPASHLFYRNRDSIGISTFVRSCDARM